jgi:hypothetical protein
VSMTRSIIICRWVGNCEGRMIITELVDCVMCEETPSTARISYQGANHFLGCEKIQKSNICRALARGRWAYARSAAASSPRALACTCSRRGVLAGHYTGGRAKAWCLLIHADASLSISLFALFLCLSFGAGVQVLGEGHVRVCRQCRCVSTARTCVYL